MMKKIEQIEGVKKGVELAKLTTFQMGGPADYYYEVKDVMMIPKLIEACKADALPYVLLGWGSNMIFSDLGFRGLIIHNLARNCELGEEVGPIGKEGEPGYRAAGRLVVAGSGTLLSQIIQFCLKNSLTGMEKLMGLPGTIGGAVRGNAGAFGLETTHLFEKALIYQPATGETYEALHPEMEFDYRHSKVKHSGEIVLKVWLRLQPGDTQAGVEEVRKIITSRAGKHPSGRSAGSFFKNPSGNSIGEGLSAGYLNDQCGFKGKHIGGAFISEKHGNFLMNDGTATMKDVLELCLEIQQAVLAKFGVKLEREVALVGEKGYIDDEFAQK
jgi:UDP-N-acetylmuramate dehydrogenase